MMWHREKMIEKPIIAATMQCNACAAGLVVVIVVGRDANFSSAQRRQIATSLRVDSCAIFQRMKKYILLLPSTRQCLV